MPQQRRRALIADLLKRGGISSQEALAEALAARGEAATQATISRDLAALGVVKARDGYHLPGEAPQRATANGRVASTLRGHGVDVQAAHSLVVVRTAPGHASVVADALDHSPPKECVGTIAGDDTVFIAAPSPTAAKRLAKELAAALEGAEAAR